MKLPFLKALPVLEAIEEAGYEAYFVGGSVRDLLLNRDIHDVDIASSATPEEIKEIFPHTVDVGIIHGTVVVLYEGNSYEVTTFRSESEYEDFRRPSEVTFIRSLIEDLRRRDFTMNAIAMNKDGKLIDPFFGQEDIKNKTIKTVGSAKERFHEDALRMMRAVRFVSQLDFKIEKSTFLALSRHGSLLRNISVERITAEFEKLLSGSESQTAMKVLVETGMYQYLPGFENRNQEINDFLQLTILEDLSLEEYWVLLLFIFSLSPRDVENFMRVWKHPLKKIRRVKKGLFWLYERTDHDWTLDRVYLAGSEIAISTERLFNILKHREVNLNVDMLEEKLASLPINERRELCVTGQDLMDWYEKQGGHWIEEKLLQIEKAVIYKEIENRKDSIKEWLLKCNQL